MNSPRYYAAAIELDGKLLITGGNGNNDRNGTEFVTAGKRNNYFTSLDGAHPEPKHCSFSGPRLVFLKLLDNTGITTNALKI